MKERLLSVSTALLLTCYGCIEQENEALSGAARSAGNAVVLTADLDRLVKNPSDPAALIELTRIFTELSAFATAGQEPIFGQSLAQKASLDQCVTVEGPLIVYDGCVVSNGTINGTVFTADEQIDLDLTIASEGSGGAGSLSVRMTGSLTLTAVLLDGQLDYVTVIGGIEEYPDGLTVTLQAEYLDITLAPDLCPLGGALRVRQEALGTSTVPQEAVFGPSCLQVRLL